MRSGFQRRKSEELESLNPDILLLAGGTDGGNADVILENAKKLALSRVHCPIVIAGNKVVADEVNADSLGCRQTDAGDGQCHARCERAERGTGPGR